MGRLHSFYPAVLAGLTAWIIPAGTGFAAPSAGYVQTNLVSDIPGMAIATDPNLKNPWGIFSTSSSPFWVSDQAANIATLYTVNPVSGSVSVNATIHPAIPMTASGPQGPTGGVSNVNSASFLVGNGGNGASAHFIFANLNGTISAWDTGAQAFIQATTPGAVYTGLAINQAQTLLYAVNNAGSGGINVFNSAFAPVSLGAGAFGTPAALGALVPFNAQDINGNVYVTYAPAGHPAETSATAGHGAVAVFNEAGTLQKTLVSGGPLASPWGVALAPAGFGQFGGDLLVGNFSYADGGINAFDPSTGAFLGTLVSDPSFQGLWGLEFGNGGSGGNPNTLYFTTGLNSETDGLLASLAVSEPGSLSLFLTGLLIVSGVLCRRRLRRLQFMR